MQVILLQDIRGIGRKNDVKNVSDGYARNFLIPKNLAKIATKQATAEIEKSKVLREKQREETETALSELADRINGKEFSFYPKIGKKQEVFSSVTKDDIKKEIVRKHLLNAKDREQISSKIKIILAKPLREIGEHEITVFMGDKKIAIKAIVNQFSEDAGLKN